MRILISFGALFLSVILLQLSTGGVGPLDAISGITLDFSTAEVGLLGSAHFLGFFIGCWWAPRLMGSVGHSRAFAAFTAAGGDRPAVPYAGDQPLCLGADARGFGRLRRGLLHGDRGLAATPRSPMKPAGAPWGRTGWPTWARRWPPS